MNYVELKSTSLISIDSNITYGFFNGSIIV